MALIVKCHRCKKRGLSEETVCSACGSELRFVVDYWPRGRQGPRRTITLPRATRTYADAVVQEKAFIAVHRTPAAKIEADSSSTVDDLFPSYLTWYKLHRSETSWQDLKNAWHHDISRLMGEYVVLGITSEHFSLYQALRSDGKVSNRTINKELDYFRGFLRWCRKEKKMEVLPIDFEALPYSSPPPIVMSPGEIARILEAAESEPFYHALILCLYSLGIRISSARRLTPEDFDFENKSVRIRQKGGKWFVLPLSDQVIEAVKKVIELRKTKPGKAVFSICKSEEPIKNMRKALARICERAKVTKKANPHLFRHSIATHMLASDVNLRTIQQYLGHSQVETTAKIYTHVVLENLRNAQASVGSLQKE